MLIFGGTGFIGRHLCNAIRDSGGSATVVSRSPDPAFIASMGPHISALSLADFQARQDHVLADHDTIIYSASQSVPNTFVDRPWLEYEQNVVPAMKLFTRAVQINAAAKVVFLSSGGTIYGANHTQPIREDALVEPISPYGLGKVTIEEGLKFLGRTRDLDYRILRISNPFGRWQNNPKQGVIPVAINAILNRQPITVYGAGQQVRDFVDADDVAQGILKAAQSEHARQETFNLGSGEGLAIADVLDMLQQMLGRELLQEHLEGRDADVLYSVLDCSHAADRLNWKATTPLFDSVEKYLAHKGIQL